MALPLPTVLRRNPALTPNTFVVVGVEQRMGAGPDETPTWDVPEEPQLFAWAGARDKIKRMTPHDADIYVGRQSFSSLDEALAAVESDLSTHGRAYLEVLNAWDDGRIEFSIKRA
jgi:hypothetical protein